MTILSVCNSRPEGGLTDTYTPGVIAITADGSFQPIVQEEIDVFEGLFSSAEIVPCYTTEVDVINQLLRDSVRLVITTRTLTPEEMNSSHSRKFFSREIELATDGLVLIANGQNTDILISVRDIRRILTGRVHAWKELCSTSKLGDTQLVSDNRSSSTVYFTVDSICEGTSLSDRDIEALRANQQMTDYVVRTPNVTGVIGVNWLGNRSDATNLSFRDEIRMMSVSTDDMTTPQNNYKSYQTCLYYGSYPLAHLIYMSLNNLRNVLPWEFVSFFTSDKEQRIILESRLVPAIQPARIVDVKDE